ncbi:CD276 antigen homolog isoform X2 [Scyliorhinus canicula]|uniref:CD276 antigen homolog isoform X2 n=1 Tax=Scyliorhinus canicula TaxID=7830 RepID=UPI0018F799B7|nr:CD276 antigen homolog isoform X2 [Scyliorhinus canicula]
MDGKQLQGLNLDKLLLLLLNVVAAVSGDSPVPVSGYLGEQVVLPCTYNGNVPVSDLRVVWQTSKGEILHKFVNGNDNLTEQDAHFRNRTTLFKDQPEQGNWSVLISHLRESDQGEYQCHIYKWSNAGYKLDKTDVIDLSVAERARTPGPNTPGSSAVVPGLTTGAAIGLGIGILAVFVVTGIGVSIFRKLQRKQNRHKINQNEAPNGVPLTGVTYSREARGLVTRAPEHQDGAAGEQNLLGNGTVQY